MMKSAASMKSMLDKISEVLFPDLCLACSEVPKSYDAHFCTDCLGMLPFTDHFGVKQNAVTMHLAGRVNIDHGAALLTFRKEGIVQKMLHQLKYKGRYEIGEILGKMSATRYQDSPYFSRPDVILPVPIHATKQRIRGYNQSEIFGTSVGQVLNVSCEPEILVKIKKTESQTGKSRTQRVENVAEGFWISTPERLVNQHVLLVDDVITTGATLEACCQYIYDGGAAKVSILCIAAAEN
ncbi:MAG: ComF family protein [Chitinophagales bacterium]|nr:ComF family protein [Chitinophagales bacterium]